MWIGGSNHLRIVVLDEEFSLALVSLHLPLFYLSLQQHIQMDCLTHKVYLYCSWSYTMLSTEAFLVSLLLLLPVVQADANLTVSGVVRRIEKVS